MKKMLAILALTAIPLVAFAGNAGVRFDTVVTEAGKTIATPSVWVPFGQEAVIEVPSKVRVVATADPANGDRSKVTVRMYYFADGAWVFDEATSMDADISQTPSFERSLDDKVHRVVVMPRAAANPSSVGM